MRKSHADTSDPGRLLLLDLDGTLVDTAEGLLACVNRMLSGRGLAPIGLADIRAMIGDGIAALVRRALAFRGAPFDETALVAFAADYERSAADHAPLFPGIQTMLGRALQDGWRLAVCTNKPVGATRTLLGSLGIAHLFAAIGGGDSFPVRKPDPEHVRLTMLEAGCVPERSVMLGDHRNDIQAATGAGISAIFAAWGYGAPGMSNGAAAIAETPEAVPAIAARILASAPFKGRAG
ncbi:HAD-IA family hydrolase [Acetobacteraceae bacterium KSS8]|uniref:phosphoglycolate phosphatase n=1 Tax=Endosaccharibacter trunci TaxID=2812733 RepID=A0ABT1W7U8_9PROT|nr:HAD-IA family hydrolase [Acetobacteraceae bacterium KSS8]